MSAPDGFEVVDRSVLRPSFVRLYVVRLLALVPRRVPANLVTLGGFGVTLALLGLCIRGGLRHVELAWTALVATQLYVAGDHLDGLQAVKSGTTSPLGEFLDHWLDFTSGAILGFAALLLMDGLPRWAFHGSIWLYVLAFTVTYVERVSKRVLYFAPVGSLEGIVILSVWLLPWLFPAGRAFMLGPSLPGGLPGYWTLPLVSALCMGGTVVVLLGRIGAVPGHFAAFVAASFAIVASATSTPAVPLVLGWAVLVLHGSEYLLRVMQPGILTEPVRPGVVAPALLSAAAAAWSLAPASAAGVVSALGWLAVAWAALRVASAAVRVLQVLGRHWVWVNR